MTTDNHDAVRELLESRGLSADDGVHYRFGADGQMVASLRNSRLGS